MKTKHNYEVHTRQKKLAYETQLIAEERRDSMKDVTVCPHSAIIAMKLIRDEKGRDEKKICKLTKFSQQ